MIDPLLYMAQHYAGEVPIRRSDGEPGAISGVSSLDERVSSGNCHHMKTAAMLVSVVDDESVRESLPDLFVELGFSSRAFATPIDFLQSAFVNKTACVILDIAIPGMSGPELRRELLRRGHNIPTIFIAAHADSTSQLQMLHEEVDCLIKPFSDTVLFDALKRALGSN